MGNCMQRGCARVSKEMEDQLIRITEVDGKIMEYKAPLLVKDLLMNYEGHDVTVNSDAVCNNLCPDDELSPGRLYSLVPKGRTYEKTESGQALKTETKTEEETSKTMRVKVVITKQQLAELLASNKGTTLEELVRHVQSQYQCQPTLSRSDFDKSNCSGWRPSLESIPEA
uniref:TSA: Wollemia nobilis Ref_Wollemi_Transcript_28859_610 transcribed RNA sequence n=1 Tax=Wollemia nobilis TaxID=56998 RepID=A0A0C9S0T8_9CONI